MPTTSMVKETKDSANRSEPLVFALASMISTADSTIKPMPTKDTHIFIIGSMIRDYLSFPDRSRIYVAREKKRELPRFFRSTASYNTTISIDL